MKPILHSEVAKERCNAAAFGAFNASITKGYKDAKSLGKSNALGYWRYNMTKGMKKGNSKEFALAIGANRALKEM